MTATARLGLPLIDASQAQKHVTHNEAIQALDQLVQTSVLSRTLASPPATPADGDAYIVASGASGAWSGRIGSIAAWQSGAWTFFAAETGWLVWVVADAKIYVWSGTAWVDAFGLLVQTLQGVQLLGIQTTADTTNRLAAKLNAALFTAMSVAEGGTGDLRYVLNKSATANTVSQLYQDNYSGRAEVGLTGDDKFHIKVSANGTTWSDAFVLDPATASLLLAGTVVTGSAVGNSRINTATLTPIAQIVGDTAPVALLVMRASATQPRILAAHARGTVAAQTAVVNNDALCDISFAGHDGTQMTEGARISAVVSSAPAANSMPTDIVFRTNPGGTTNPTEALRIGADSSLLIGGTGAALKRLLSATVVFDFPAIATGATASTTVTVTGALIGDTVTLGLPAAPAAGIVFQATVSAADTVTLTATNITAASVNPASATYRVTIIGF